MNTPELQNKAAPRILIVRVGAMGDVLHGMPAVAALRVALPNAFIGWAIEPRWAPLLSSGTGGIDRQPIVDTVHRVEAKAWSKHPLSRETFRSIRQLRGELRGRHYDLSIDLQGSIRSALIARASGARCILGSATPREIPAGWFYTQHVKPALPHVIEQAVELVSAAALQQLAPAAAPLPKDPAAQAWCETFLGNDERPQVLLAPTAGWGAKQWPALRYGQLAQQLAAYGYRVLINASPHGVDTVAASVVQASGHTAQVAACTLPQLIALLRRVQLAVAGDSGPLHLAVALGVPVVALFGPTDPARNGPHAASAIVLRHASSQTDHRRHAQAEAGLQQVQVAEVLAAALQQLSAPKPSHG